VRYVVAYNVADDHRRQQVATIQEAWGRRIQKSIFECEWIRKEAVGVSARLGKLLKLETHRCRIYPVCAECYPKRMVQGTEFEAEWKETITT
jgi:CRISPR-associated protein Cas2